jgi:hypothetical protein
MSEMNDVVPSTEKIIWSAERQKWLCYDNDVIDAVIESNHFRVPSYDYSELENKFSKNFEFTKQVIDHFPLANEGAAHQNLRARMSSDINLNLKQAIRVFCESLEDQISALNEPQGMTNIAVPIIESILKSNLILANVSLEDNFDYSDVTRMLDDSQSIKSRMVREMLVKNMSAKLPDQEKFYQLALISVGVNALISSSLQSIIKILSNHDFKDLINTRFFSANGIKHLERVCTENTVLAGEKIRTGDKVRLFVAAYEKAELTESQMNKKFFAAESHHACIGMNYSISVWRKMMKIFSTHFSRMRLINFDYRSNDGIFHFPTHVHVEYSK